MGATLKKIFLGLTVFAVSLLLLKTIQMSTTYNVKAVFRNDRQGSTGISAEHKVMLHNKIVDYLPCNWSVHNIPHRPKRQRVVLRCSKISANISYEEVPFNTTPAVTTLPPHDPCLARLVNSSWCNDATSHVPRLVHYVWYSPRKMALYTFVSVLSAVRYVSPCLVLFHGDALPDGPYWRALLQLVPNIVHVTCDRPRQIFGHVINKVEHKYGGIYLDTDQLVLKSLDRLRIHPVVMGIEIYGQSFGNAMIMSQQGAEFLKLWLAEYVTFDDSQWAHHSTRVPYLLYTKRPDMVHVVDSFFRPNWQDIEKFYLNKKHEESWEDLLAVHLYPRLQGNYFAADESVVQQNCAVGQILRYVLYGSSDACQLDIPRH